MKINADKGTYTEEEILETLKNILGQDANIKIELVDKIPVIASGKLKKTICNYKPKNEGK